MTLFKWLSLILLLILSEFTSISWCQAGADDSGVNEASDNAASAPAQDPSIVNPTKNQGYGAKDENTPNYNNNNKQTSGRSGKQAKQQPILTIGEQTVQTALQFGVLVMRKY